MATNRRKVMVPNTMGQEGVALLRARDDIETVVYPPTISQAELLPMLEDCAGIALSLTPYRQAEMDASPAMQVVARIGVGYDAVDVPVLTARRAFHHRSAFDGARQSEDCYGFTRHNRMRRV